LDKGGILYFILEIIRFHLNLLLLAFFESSLDFRIVDELNLWNDDMLLALDQIDFELSQVFLDVIKAL
jgi:hypothetical protein